MNDQLKRAVEDVYSKSAAVKEAVPNADIRAPAFALRQSVVALCDAPTTNILESTARYYLRLHQACERVVSSSKESADTVYQPEETKTLLRAASDVHSAARDFQLVVRSVTEPLGEPILSDDLKTILGIAAIVLAIVGTASAVVGPLVPAAVSDSLTRLSYWCGLAALAIAGLWTYATFVGRRSPLVGSGPGTAPSELQYLIFGGMGFLVLAFLIIGVMTGDLKQYLQTSPGARGLITFMIAIGTIAIAVILALASVIVDPDSDNETLKTRLAAGKEILTVLVGVLGTIVGFYFANNGGTPTPAADKASAIGANDSNQKAVTTKAETKTGTKAQ